MQRQLAALNLEYSFVDAIDKYDMVSKKYRASVAAQLGIDESVMEYKYNKIFWDKSFPVLLSHLKAYRIMCENNVQQACILEDDTYLLPDFPKVLAASQKLPCWDILKLNYYGATSNSIMRCLFKKSKSPAHLSLFRTLTLIVFMYAYGMVPDRAMERLFSKYCRDDQEYNLPSWKSAGLMRYRGYYGKLNLYIAYQMMLKVLHCFFDVWGNHIYFNTVYGKILKRYTDRRRIRIDEPSARFCLATYYAFRLGLPLRRDKASWHKIAAQYYIAEPAEFTSSAGAYMITRETATVFGQVTNDIDVPIQHIDLFPYILSKYKGIKLYVCFPPCAQTSYRYLLNSTRVVYPDVE